MRAGFSLLESLVAMAVVALIVTAAAAVLNPLHGTFQAQPETADEQQRLRAGVNVLTAALRAAGSGALVGAARGPLVRSLPPVLPYRIGEDHPDSLAGVRYRTDVISIVSVPQTAAQATLAAGAAAGATFLTMDWPSSCPPPTASSVCAFKAGMHALVFDGTGRWDAITVVGVSGNTLEVARPGGLAFSYAAGAIVVEGAIRVFAVRPDASGVPQLYDYDGFGAEFPAVDNVVGLRFDYFGEPEPPRRLPGTGLDTNPGPWTTYGPRPPAPDVDDGADAWPTGESCVFQVIDGVHTARLADLWAGPDLVPLDDSVLTDGPWCPDAAGGEAYDADLFRIRRIRVTLRVQVASSALRGISGTLFARGGQSTSGERFVPDQEIAFDVAPPNLLAARR